MNWLAPKRLVAIQFCVIAFFASKMIPQVDDVILPIIWLFDKRVTMAYLSMKTISFVIELPWSITFAQGILFSGLMPWSLGLMHSKTDIEFSQVINSLFGQTLILFFIVVIVLGFLIMSPIALSISSSVLRKKIKKHDRNLYNKFFMTKKEIKQWKEQQVTT